MTTPPRKRRIRLPRTTIISLASELTPLVSSSVLFFLLVGLLPTDQYGIFVTITASAMIITPIARAGAGVVLLRDIGAQRADEPSWNDALNTTLTTTTFTVLLWLLVGGTVVPGATLLASVALFWQQLVPMAISDLATAYLVVKNDLPQSLLARITFAAWRILGLAAFWAIGRNDLETLGVILAATGLAGAGQNVLRLRSHSGLASKIAWPEWSTMRRGLPDSVSAATGSVLDSVDRPLLTRAGFVEDTARYGVGMRLVGLASVPTLAILRPFDHETFRAGAISVTRTTAVMVRAARRTFPAALVSAALLWSVAGFIPELLPPDYAEATDIIRWGVWMVPMRALSFPFGNVLTAAGHRMTRLTITAVAATGNVIANIVLIPRYNWRAAVGTTLAAELFMVVATTACCWFYVRREQSQTS